MYARLRDFFAGLSPRTLAWSASAAAVAILLQAGLIAGIMIKENGAAPRPAAATIRPPRCRAGLVAMARMR